MSTQVFIIIIYSTIIIITIVIGMENEGLN